jgi:hypothetical protein
VQLVHDNLELGGRIGLIIGFRLIDTVVCQTSSLTSSSMYTPRFDPIYAILRYNWLYGQIELRV